MKNKINNMTVETKLQASGNFFDKLFNIVFSILDVLTIYIGVLLSVAFYTLAERKFMGSVQRRMGPNVVGFMGLLQAFADALKLIFKELVIPYRANKVLFVLAPFAFLTLALLGWAVIPLAVDVLIADILYGILFIYLVSSLSVFGVIIAGWSSNSKYPFLGALRSAAQMISYEVSMGFILITVCLVTGTFNLVDIVLAQEDVWFVFLLFPLFLMFLVSILAETNRAPFDLPEAEAELVAGYNLEYSGIMFAMFFLAEYSNMLLMSFLTVHLFLGGWFSIPVNFYDMFTDFSQNYLYYGLVFLHALDMFLIKIILFIHNYFPKLFWYFYAFKVEIQEGFLYINTREFSSRYDNYSQEFKLDELLKLKAKVILNKLPPILEKGYLMAPAFFEDLDALLKGYLRPFSLLIKTPSSVAYQEALQVRFYSEPFKPIFSNYIDSSVKYQETLPCLDNKTIKKSFIFGGLKVIFLSIFFILTRAALPRYRYDQLMYIGWKSFLPLTLGYLVFILGFFYYFSLFPDTSGNPFFFF